MSLNFETLVLNVDVPKPCTGKYFQSDNFMVKFDLTFTIVRYNIIELMEGKTNMFGYIIPNFAALDDVQKRRYKSVYCGLCRVLRMRHGFSGTLTLSNDLTFLALLLNALYEPAEICGEERCLTHPAKRHSYSVSEPFEYIADMNVALAYHKCMDNWMDDKNLLSLGEANLLKHAYLRVAKQYPNKCAAIEAWLEEIHAFEKQNHIGIDGPVNCTGRLLGELFCWKDDFWASKLRLIGDGLGRFIYMMDAYDDLANDLKHGSYNPLASYHHKENYESMCKDALVMMVADCTQEFEQLPIVQDADLLRNVLYSGIWSKYTQIQKKKESNGKGV